ncbi:UDP-3-O-[3-hydroxymyristoyl] glucosamine N-acyltransferase [Lewinella marina]|uniref:UDP-3-O-(3-hydroxymyristoyl)glucosamine N-acyltransferase n=1 Tax=Neolewinella marina TaxID=438751 RepID=A0A2G0CD21_9BACT|nr:LpxD N-terminal domain-containing protein [Neolewinella marina]NJB86949.1 UDP-3-O-[3-hydroxymyristoyl] glucosamine N-acyltransferase [Neolewinella marina]PHK97855.1 UDP-3-O-(3-hydroxymyristoyl)glucosamine N-acyltransferase [Neolewinella marina]
MKLAQPTTAAALSERLGARLVGDGELAVTGLNEIHHAEAGDLCFVDHPRYYAPTLASAASVILIDREQDCPPGKALLVHPEPFALYNRLVWEARPPVPYQAQEPTATVGEGTVIAPGVVLGRNVSIGRDCRLEPNCVIGDGCVLGDRVTVSAGCVVGGEAFYFKRTAEGLIPWRSGGSVWLQDDVFLGPCCTIARGVSSVTVIGRGSKLDAQVQIGHDCKVGNHVQMAAQVGVAGNSNVGDWSVLQGQAGVAQNVTLGERTVIMAQSGVGRDLEGGKSWFGSPVQEARKAFRDLVKLRRLGE